jgi:hypothetical protein
MHNVKCGCKTYYYNIISVTGKGFAKTGRSGGDEADGWKRNALNGGR